MAAANADNSMEQLFRNLLVRGDWEALRRMVRQMDPADLADLVEDLPTEMRERVFGLFDPETASGVLAEMDAPFVEDLVEELQSEQLAELAEHMAPDEAADLIAELDEEQGDVVLAAMSPDDREEVREVLSHGEGTAGRLMTTEVVSCTDDATVADALALARASSQMSDPVMYVYVVARDSGRLLGGVSLQELLSAEPQRPVRELLDDHFIYSVTSEDQQEVARKFRKYDLWVMPVVDEQGRLVGRITVDDVIDVVHEEADEDLARMVGAPDIEEDEDSLWRIVRLRLPWLLITMFAGMTNSIIIRAMLRTTRIETIAIFIPAILAMGGNTGMQSSAVCIRGIALDESKYSRMWAIVRREIRVGITLGLLCGLATAGIAWLVLRLTAAPGNLRFPPLHLAATVGLAMCNAMGFASAFGSVVPIVLHRLRIDPALASGPFVTTSNDLSATLIYFLTCTITLGISG